MTPDRFGHGMVLGKFYPFHIGHQQLIRAAEARCAQVTVLVLSSAVESIPGPLRADWIAAEHPRVRVLGGRDETPNDFTDPLIWDRHLAVIEALLPAPVDAVFTSDDYGAELARRLRADWVRVDPGRRGIPVSGTRVRADPAGHWWALPTPVREWFCRRVVVVGAESTGSTTLARSLAEHYGVPWVPEYGREWSVRRPAGAFGPWHSSEFDLIAAEHARQEVAAMRRTPRPLIVSDTDALATALWHERYLGTPSPSVRDLAAARRPDLYLLTGAEIAWVDDGTRDGTPQIRAAMQQRFRDELDAGPTPWLLVQGDRAARLAAAVAAIDRLLTRGWELTDPLG
ncbi:AAA family ATPase [Granulicoccus phenolivorans]|uniref:AAA family ATPase n=1 Tax=Granulicoccus phenolivorans TaxID=266854 RepID=UPI0003F60F26|nr:AAA family ATPase [Granulicoccus phenolivorans]